MKLLGKLGRSHVLCYTLQHKPAVTGGVGEWSPPSDTCETTSACCVLFGAHSARQSPTNWSESSGNHQDGPGALRR